MTSAATKGLELTGGSVAARPRVPVLLPVALEQTYDYALPDGVVLEPGTFILVPFGPQTRIGVVWDRPTNPDDTIDARKLKPVVGRLDVPPLPVMSMRFTEWIARYTVSPLGMVLRMMMGAQSAFDPPKPRSGVAIVPGAATPPRMTPARERAIEIASDGLIRTKAALASEAGCTVGVVDGLVKAGVLVDSTTCEASTSCARRSMRMLLSTRGKKRAPAQPGSRASWVRPRLRPCSAKRWGPKISDRTGASSGPSSAPIRPRREGGNSDNTRRHGVSAIG